MIIFQCKGSKVKRNRRGLKRGGTGGWGTKRVRGKTVKGRMVGTLPGNREQATEIASRSFCKGGGRPEKKRQVVGEREGGN